MPTNPATPVSAGSKAFPVRRVIHVVHPAAQVEPDPIFLVDRGACTSAGVTARIDPRLAVVENNLDLPLIRPIAIAATLAAVPIPPLRAEYWLVDADGHGDCTSIQDAMDAAASGDTIELPVPLDPELPYDGWWIVLPTVSQPRPGVLLWATESETCPDDFS